ncbi:hypothetical protein [Bradyrhizobium sp. STM 3562]|uniref:hypothetical protein n=1 Tax=Bradyrhizobium sp. STM 3562 TaxID=578924 RepID=UPI00388DB3C8
MLGAPSFSGGGKPGDDSFMSGSRVLLHATSADVPSRASPSTGTPPITNRPSRFARDGALSPPRGGFAGLLPKFFSLPKNAVRTSNKRRPRGFRYSQQHHRCKKRIIDQFKKPLRHKHFLHIRQMEASILAALLASLLAIFALC